MSKDPVQYMLNYREYLLKIARMIARYLEAAGISRDEIGRRIESGYFRHGIWQTFDGHYLLDIVHLIGSKCKIQEESLAEIDRLKEKGQFLHGPWQSCDGGNPYGRPETSKPKYGLVYGLLITNTIVYADLECPPG